ncbi:MAG: DNA repair and recombination protein RadB [Candidatus Nanohalobium sp.]
MEVERLSTSCESIDELLNGGVEKGIITNVYGESGSGKTNFAVQLAAQVTMKGKKVAYVDTEAGFSPERFLQIADEEALDRVMMREPLDFDEQEDVIEQLSEVVEGNNVGLVVVDSAVSLYRLQVNGENASEINNRLSQQFSDLSNIARRHNIPVVVTNQVYTSFDEEGLEIVGRDVPKYWSKCLIQLSQSDKNVRKLEISKHRALPEGRNTKFKITNQGLESVDEDGLF